MLLSTGRSVLSDAANMPSSGDGKGHDVDDVAGPPQEEGALELAGDDSQVAVRFPFSSSFRLCQMGPLPQDLAAEAAISAQLEAEVDEKLTEQQGRLQAEPEAAKPLLSEKEPLLLDDPYLYLEKHQPALLASMIRTEAENRKARVKITPEFIKNHLSPRHLFPIPLSLQLSTDLRPFGRFMLDVLKLSRSDNVVFTLTKSKQKYAYLKISTRACSSCH
jgi:hypothetical protein